MATGLSGGHAAYGPAIPGGARSTATRAGGNGTTGLDACGTGVRAALRAASLLGPIERIATMAPPITTNTPSAAATSSVRRERDALPGAAAAAT